MERIPGYGPITQKDKANREVGEDWGAKTDLVWGYVLFKVLRGVIKEASGSPSLESGEGSWLDVSVHHMIELRLGVPKGYQRMQGLGAEKSLAES